MSNHKAQQSDTNVLTSRPASNGHRGLEPGQVARFLGEWRPRELRIARGFRECRSLNYHELEDIYQETTLTLLQRPDRYLDEAHLRNTLRLVIKQRALHLYRDERRRQEILAENAPGMHALELARAISRQDIEQLALARQDRLIITEFLAELTPDQRQVFWLMTESMGYNRIAKTLRMPVNQARKLVLECEQKRERYQTLYDHGRLCGYRSTTIKALLEGQATSEQLAKLALAHIQACAHCRAQHHTNATRLRHAFEQQAAALLPPVMLDRLSRLDRTITHLQMLAQRLQTSWGSSPGAGPSGGGARERTIALLAGGGTSAKLAAGLVTVAVITGSTLSATHALEEHPHHHPRASATAQAANLAGTTERAAFAQTEPAQAAITTVSSPTPPPPRAHTPQHPDSPAHDEAANRNPVGSTETRREPGGFAYLGVPNNTPTPTPAQPTPTPASTPTPAPAQQQQQQTTTGGGPFSP
ncbi:MAG TPA: sigma-70 family RNA polymerase sigma factor [Solirubrobacteraceae bacterium]|nr:sigma-70 family RNA polymerase sigma factor [Solirubrobacteraceae bacterium]